MSSTSSSLSLSYVNDHGDERDIGHDNGIDSMAGDVSTVVIDLTHENTPTPVPNLVLGMVPTSALLGPILHSLRN